MRPDNKRTVGCERMVEEGGERREEGRAKGAKGDRKQRGSGRRDQAMRGDAQQGK
jgi:hypothetical protein